MKGFINYIIECHSFFFKESKSFVGVEKKDKSKPYPIFGWITDWNTKPFNQNNKIWGFSRVGYETYYSYPLKTLLYLPIAYFKFMYYSITTKINHNKKY